MSWRRRLFSRPWVLRSAAAGVRALLVALSRTYRIEIRGDTAHLDRAQRGGGPVILSFWHNRLFIAAAVTLRELLRRDDNILALASQSRDGELVTHIAHRLGFQVVRGSASRGGRDAMRAIYRATTRQGASPAILPDGPRGPLYQFKVGVVILAQMSQTPILPIGIAAQRFLRIGSWDRIIVPWPFSRVTLVVGEPQRVERRLSMDELETERRRIQELLDELTRRAEDALGVRDPSRL